MANEQIKLILEGSNQAELINKHVFYGPQI